MKSRRRVQTTPLSKTQTRAGLNKTETRTKKNDVAYLLTQTPQSFPESTRLEMRFVAKTSGVRSRRMWCVARRRRMWAGCGAGVNERERRQTRRGQKIRRTRNEKYAPSFPLSVPFRSAMSLTCMPSGPASRRISTVCEASRRRMHDGR